MTGLGGGDFLGKVETFEAWEGGQFGLDGAFMM